MLYDDDILLARLAVYNPRDTTCGASGNAAGTAVTCRINTGAARVTAGADDYAQQASDVLLKTAQQVATFEILQS